MKKIRVMHIIHELCLGGAQNGVINLVNSLDPGSFETSVCTFVNDGVLTDRVNRSKTTLFGLGKTSGNDLTLPFRIFKTVRKWKPDIVHTHSWGTLCEGVLGAKCAGVPVIIHGEHGTIQSRPRNIAVQRFFWNRVDQVLSVSEMHKRQLSETIQFPREKIHVIINGVDVNRFFPSSQNQRYREKTGIKNGETVIGTVGRLNPVKNYPLLLKAFSRLYEKERGIRLVFVGDGEAHEELATLADSLGLSSQTLFLGRRSDIPALLHLMDIFVLPSLSEGMSNTILEAMSCAIPVVATSVGGNVELVNHNLTGLLLPSDDLDAMTNALGDLVKNPEKRAAMGLEGKACVERRFSIRTMVANYENLYKSMAGEKRF